MFNDEDRILVVAAHPDDEVLAMGGLLSLAKKNKLPVSVLFLGEGVSARFAKTQFSSAELYEAHEIRMEGAKKALKFLGVENIKYGKHLCCRFDGVENLDLVKSIESKIDEFKPTQIYTHNPIEVNIDHRLTYQAVETAVRPKPGLSVKKIYSFEIPCSGNWTFDGSFKPNTYVNIESVWEEKLFAWRCYEGEERPFPFPRSDKGLEVLANYRGMQSGIRLAEAFKLLRHTAVES